MIAKALDRFQASLELSHGILDDVVRVGHSPVMDRMMTQVVTMEGRSSPTGYSVGATE